ncbi:[protein-PII] uridylyltransferase [Halioxenophilus sp. WMMB6]|uniref:[protein-PII] uridylyltransferase n=1 Tax=Halioxenophilus sp. WMMB6 TaxID=3073815 RepID=UPI00295F0DEB|nr:[protein-PII] uridylyltransferase [Halioxenophilus sp. WMMB6]
MQPPYFESPLVFFDQEKFRQNLANSQERVTIFKDALAAADAHFNKRFWDGASIRSLVSERAMFVDCMLHYAWHQFLWTEQCGLLAVGGYGRKELHPHSDIDILILFEEECIESQAHNIEAFVMLLWDIGLDIGHSVRTLEQCTRLAKDDITIVTNMMECRTIVGPKGLAAGLKAAVGPDKIWPAEAFFTAKLAEQEKRHKKYNFTEYNLEPNIKNAPGGLRDIQTICWVTKRFFGIETLADLEGQNFITARELAVLHGGQEFLWRVRYGLHLLAGRSEERLLFNYQTELAVMFGYSNSEKRLAVEQFMHWYYRVVLSLRELNDVILQYLSEAILHKDEYQKITPINERFRLANNYIEVTHPKVFEESPSALLEIFVLMGSMPHIQGVRAATIRLIRENRDLIDENYRNKPLHIELFYRLLKSPFDLFTVLKRMTRYGVLGRYLPEFGRITGQMQHDLFHIYTVDAHTLHVIKHIHTFGDSEAKNRFPIAHHIYRNLRKQELLVLAGLYHDIGKGRGGDHSLLGAKDLKAFCKRHKLTRRDTNLVVWLVEQHLKMSSVSQKEDIADPEVVRNFALEVGDQEHLDYLYTLTVADMNATNPNIWNNWRASLLRQLYMETKRVLRRGLENPVDRQDIVDETQQLALFKLADRSISEAQVRAVWGDINDDYFIREHHLDIAWQTAAVLEAEEADIVIAFNTSTSFHTEGATQIFIRTQNRKNVFATTASTLDHLNLNIQEARIYESDSGVSVDHYYVLDQHGRAIGNDLIRLNKIKTVLNRELAMQTDDSASIHRRTPRELKHFRIPTQTGIYNDLISGQTLLEVISPDRPGLLARIGQIFIDQGIHLTSARISTLGERVEDVFMISDLNGEPLSDPNHCEQLQAEIRRQLDEQNQAQDAQALA